MSEFFINRPNFAWVVTIFISLAGILSISSLSVEKYPQVAPPQIVISVTYPGASASVLNDSVTSLIEEELNGAKGLLYYESVNNANGTANITVTFAPGTNADFAQVDVQNRIKKAESRLPGAVKDQGIDVEQSTAGFLMIYTLGFKDGYENGDPQVLADFMARNINNEIRRVAGVGKVQFFAAESAMRVWINPQKLMGYGLTVADVNRAISAQNIQVPAGTFGARPTTSSQEITATLMVKGTLASPGEFGGIILRANEDGSSVRLADVARLEIGPEDYSSNSKINGSPAACAGVQLAPGANAPKTVFGVKKRLKELSASFPEEITYFTPFDTSRFVEVAIEKVLHTLLEAACLIFLVMFLFLQNLRYTIIPTIVVPVCLLGTLGVMSALGFSVNMMTMFGMVLAIGTLVDDAIVVVENVERIMATEGLSPKVATIKAMKQISWAVVGITLVLSAVFLPLSLMSGSVGVIYRQFSMSVAVSILFSGFLALTMTPALCATLLKPVQGHGKKGFFGLFNRSFERLAQGYEGMISKLVVRTGRMMFVYLVLAGILAYFYLGLPESFVPDEDLGYMVVSTQLPPGATYNRTISVSDRIQEYLSSRPAMGDVVSILGFSFSGMGQNAALAYGNFKHWSRRTQTAQEEILAANTAFSGNKDGQIFAVNAPPIDGMGNTGGFSLRLLDRAGVGRAALTDALNRVLAGANQSPVIRYARVEGLPDAPQLRLNIDRQKAEVLGVGFSSISTLVSSTFGSTSINEFINAGRVQRVIVQADADKRMSPDSLSRLFVTNARGDQVPLSAFTTLSWETGPVQIARYNGYNAYKISGSPASGYASGQAMAEMERLISALPPGIGYEWTGLSYQEKFTGAQAPILFALAVTVVFLLLVALYESWSIPLSVMLIVPIGALGSVLAAWGNGLPNDVYFKIGLITIIGLSAKNAILIVEFARELAAQGHTLMDAAVTAARVRFRPIIMTSMTFILGVVPLTLATGAGSASQNAIGTGVIGGMLSATLIGIVFVPPLFVRVQSLFGKKR